MSNDVLVEDSITIPCIGDPTQRILESFKINLKIRKSLSDACTIAHEGLNVSGGVFPGLCLENSLDSFEIKIDFETIDDSGNIKVNIQVELVSPLELPTGNSITWVNPIVLEDEIIPDSNHILEKYESACSIQPLTRFVKVNCAS